MSNLLITGANGFVGRHVVREFLTSKYSLFTPRSSELDLLDVDKLLSYCLFNKIESIIHLAATCGGIGINAEKPADFIFQNLQMGMNVLQVAKTLDGFRTNRFKITLLGTVCSYPKYTPVPFKETDLWNGYPEETNAPYGIAKKTVMLMGQAYRRQHGMDVITLIPVNMAGECDNFDPNTSHVIPALIRKMVTAKELDMPSVSLWGDGSASREFLYAGDCARAIRLAHENYSSIEPVNIGTGAEITIKELAEKVALKVGYRGIINWDTTKPNGQPRRCLDVSMAKKHFNFEAEVGLDEMLDRAIRFYQENKTCLDGQ
jgi:GDP-L-fucose synthase